MTDETLDTYRKAVERVYQANAEDSPHDFALAAGASPKVLKQAAEAIGAALDTQLASVWAMANGSDNAPLLMDGDHLASYALLSITEAIAEREHFRQRAPQYSSDGNVEENEPRDGRVGAGWFSEGWLPFASSAGGLMLILDHQPNGSGKGGQVIGYAHDPDELFFVADSLSELLSISRGQIEADPLEFLEIF